MKRSPVQNLALFAYDFPHRKMQDFLFRLIVDGIRPQIVLAAKAVELDLPKPSIRVKPRHVDLVHPRLICDVFGIEYQVVKHNSKQCADLLKSKDIEIGLICGARIIKRPIIDSVKRGIINLHPGLLPEVRGLDALQWAIYEGKSLGVTAHVIDDRIDAGYILKRVIIEEYRDDSLIDLSLRLQETQTRIVSTSIETLARKKLDSLEYVGKGSILREKMPAEIECTLPDLLVERLQKSGK